MKQLSLLKTRRFLPLFITQFASAFNDNLFKNAIVTLITFRLAEEHGFDSGVVITLVFGVYIFPYIPFSSLAGQLADKYEKSALICRIRIAELLISCGAAAALIFEDLWWLVILLFLLSTKSAFFGPLKFSILPQHLREEELVAGNGLVSAGTNIAIITGTLFGGLFIMSPYGSLKVSAGIIGVAAAGYISARFIPRADSAAPGLAVDKNIFRSTAAMLSYPLSDRKIFLSMLGICWFYFLGSVFLAQLPSFTKFSMGGNEQVSTFFLVVFSLGVGAGSVLCNKLLHGRVSGRYLSLSLAGVSVFTFLLYIISMKTPHGGSLAPFSGFISRPQALGVTFSMFMVAAGGGLYSVPVYAILQKVTPSAYMSRVIASLNVMTSFAMVAAAGMSAAMLALGTGVNAVFLALAALNVFAIPLAERIRKENDE